MCWTAELDIYREQHKLNIRACRLILYMGTKSWDMCNRDASLLHRDLVNETSILDSLIEISMCRSTLSAFDTLAGHVSHGTFGIPRENAKTPPNTSTEKEKIHPYLNKPSQSHLHFIQFHLSFPIQFHPISNHLNKSFSIHNTQCFILKSHHSPLKSASLPHLFHNRPLRKGYICCV